MDTLWGMQIRKLRLHRTLLATSIVVPTGDATNSFYRVITDYIVH